MEEVVKVVIWADSAQSSFDNIINYLTENWTEKEIKKFVARAENVIAVLRRYPEMGRPSETRKNVRITILNKHTKMVYHYLPSRKRLTLLLFWNMKRNPAGFKY